MLAARNGRSVVRAIRATPQQLQGVMWMSNDKDKGSGGAGAVRGAGGKFAERESAFENEYFHKVQREQLAKLKDHFADEIKHHEEEIKRHQEAIKRFKEKGSEIEKSAKK